MTSRSQTLLTSQQDSYFAGSSSPSSFFASQPFLLSATTNHSDTKIFAPQYQQHTPLPFQYQNQLPYKAPPAPRASSQPQVYPSHQQRIKRQPSLKYASYASRTIPPMMTPAPLSMIQFDRAFLNLAKRRLAEERHVASHHFDYCKDKPLREAAVCMPLCIVKGVPSVLFTVRSSKLRNHRGECSFPGGKRDPTDENCLATALREMHEEVFIPPSDVEILGEYAPMPNKDCTMRVQPFVGFIRTPINDVASIRFNPDEVQKVFTIPIEDLLDPQKRKNLVRFRDSKYMYPVWHVEQEDCTVWGLTAFILDGVLRRMASQGPVGAMVCPEGANIQRYKPPPTNPDAPSPSIQVSV
ncbi:nudix (nucleoside diphosphate linked moiety X)-type motif 8 [Mortierella alpina]|nr:nudix (nucleoside diphosphate linked moiety X)-type motif 8 [Mortierella alpina]